MAIFMEAFIIFSHALGVPPGRTIVIERCHLVFDDIVQGLAFHRILVVVVLVLLAVSDAPARSGLYPSHHQPSMMLTLSTPLRAAFIPEVPQASMGRRGVLSQTSAPWTRHAGNVHIVVFEKNESVAQVGAPAEIHQAADDPLALVVLGMGLAGKDELDGPIGWS
jgi:hypothetical protein